MAFHGFSTHCRSPDSCVRPAAEEILPVGVPGPAEGASGEGTAGEGDLGRRERRHGLAVGVLVRAMVGRVVVDVVHGGLRKGGDGGREVEMCGPRG